MPLLYRINADLLLVNGPGTCLPVCLVTQLLNALLFRRTRAVFVESLCRVQTLSTTGALTFYALLVRSKFVFVFCSEITIPPAPGRRAHCAVATTTVQIPESTLHWSLVTVLRSMISHRPSDAP